MPEGTNSSNVDLTRVLDVDSHSGTDGIGKLSLRCETGPSREMLKKQRVSDEDNRGKVVGKSLKGLGRLFC
jgi:hypothetical protein